MSALISTGAHYSELSDKGKTAFHNAHAKYGVSIETMVAEIERTITRESLQLGYEWYGIAYAYARGLSAKYGIDFYRVVAVISALSPRMSWPRNKAIAEHTLAVFTNATDPDISTDTIVKSIGGALGANLTIAVRILQGESIDSVLTGVKRRSFYNNIAFANTDLSSVTVDTWMQRVAMRASTNPEGVDLDESLKYLNANRKVTNGAGAGYIGIAEAVRIVAERHGWPASTIQAAYWIVASGSVHGNHHKGHGLSTNDYDN